MSPDSPLHNKQQRKKARRKDRKQRERLAHRNLDETTSLAIAEALRAAQTVTSADSAERVVALDIELASVSEAQFVRKRINDALKVDEWLDDVRVVIWESTHRGPALSPTGDARGVELRIKRRE